MQNAPDALLPADTAGLLRLLLTSPEACGIHRLAPRAFFFPRRDGAENVVSLDGEWEFRGFDSPAAAFAALTGGEAAEFRTMPVPGSWAMHGFDFPHYTNVQMPFEAATGEIPEKNPTGLYRRDFTVPETWRGQRIVLRFEGAESAFVCRLNGAWVGGSKDSRGASEFDVTALLRPGANRLEVVVIKWSDGTWLEDQDYWYLPGLTRSVRLWADDPEFRITDFFAAATLADDGGGVIDFTAAVAAPKSVPSPSMWEPSVAGGAPLALVLADPDGKVVWETTVHEVNDRFGGGDADPLRRPYRCRAEVPGVRAWSAESPTLYTLSLSLADPDGRVRSATSVRIGFRSVRVAERKLLINGQPVRIHGVNRHEFSPVNGRAVTSEEMRRDLAIMKRYNINAIRTSHYPDAPEFYDLCDELGFYVIDETNIEHHAYYNSFCNDPRWLDPYLDRVSRCFERDKNHPCVFAWSLGNESGCGPAHAAGAAWLRHRDPSRLIHYEGALRVGECDAWENTPPDRLITDLIAPMYPSLERLRRWSRNIYDERPLVMCEYSHAMGNSNGSLADYFEVFDTVPGVQGGFIWEWCDHGIPLPLAGGGTAWGYGGDFGDLPTDRNFCADGLVSPDRVPHPAMEEYKFLARPVTAAWEKEPGGALRLTNRRYFTTLDDLELVWRVERESPDPVASGRVAELPAVAPCSSASLALPLPELPALLPGERAMLRLEFRLRAAAPWAPAGTVLAAESLELPACSAVAAPPAPVAAAPAIAGFPDRAEIRCGELETSVAAEGIRRVVVGGVEVIRRGPRLQLWRAATDNDGIPLRPERKRGVLLEWRAKGIDRLRVTPDRFTPGAAEVSCHALAAAPGIPNEELEFAQTVSVRSDGALEYLADFLVPEAFADLPRLGVELEIPPEFDRVEYCGMGPHENYSDRRASAAFGFYRTDVAALHTRYVMPQENGGRTGVEYLALRDAAGRGVAVVAATPLTFTASRFGTWQLWEKLHDAELKEEPVIHLSLDLAQRGLGTMSCGPDALPEYRLVPGRFRMRLVFAPLAPGEALAPVARRLFASLTDGESGKKA